MRRGWHQTANHALFATLVTCTLANLSWSRPALAQQLGAHAGGATDTDASRGWELHWEAPAGCPSAAQVRATVARLVGARAATTDSAPLTVRATVVAGGTGAPWRLQLLTQRGTARGHRALEDTRCRALADAAALIVAMTLDPSAGARLLTPQGEPPPLADTADAADAPDAPTDTPPTTSAHAPDAPSDAADAPAASRTASEPAPAVSAATPADPRAPTAAASPASTAAPRALLAAQLRPAAPRAQPAASAARVAPARRGAHTAAPGEPADASLAPAPSPRETARPDRARLALGAGASGDTGLLPGVSLGVRVMAAARLRHWRFELAAGYWPTRVGTVPQRPGARGEVDAFSLSASVCRTATFGVIELGGCAMADGAVVRARGLGVIAPGQGVGPWFALGAGGAIAVEPWRHLALRATVGALVPLVRPDFYLEDVGSAHQAAWLTGRATLDVEVRF